jgi:hypothetical protein
MRYQQYLTEDKWVKEWYNASVDRNNKKIYSWSLGEYKIIPTGEHPTRGFNHKMKKTFWAILNPKTGATMKPTYESLAKAKKQVEEMT